MTEQIVHRHLLCRGRKVAAILRDIRLQRREPLVELRRVAERVLARARELHVEQRAFDRLRLAVKGVGEPADAPRRGIARDGRVAAHLPGEVLELPPHPLQAVDDPPHRVLLGPDRRGELGLGGDIGVAGGGVGILEHRERLVQRRVPDRHAHGVGPGRHQRAPG